MTSDEGLMIYDEFLSCGNKQIEERDKAIENGEYDDT